jgi:hypothetical protein
MEEEAQYDEGGTDADLPDPDADVRVVVSCVFCPRKAVYGVWVRSGVEGGVCCTCRGVLACYVQEGGLWWLVVCRMILGWVSVIESSISLTQGDRGRTNDKYRC